jgi:hypothetical protein
MAKINIPMMMFLGGEIGPEVQGRVTLEGYGSTASIMENALPDVEGELMMRPGLGFLSATPGNAVTHLQEFIRTSSLKYLLMLTDNACRIVFNNGVVVTQAVSSTVVDGTFSSLAGWTNISTGGGSATVSGGLLRLISDGISVAGIRQNVATSSAGVAHTLKIVVTNGIVQLKVGSASGDDSYVASAELRTGTHFLTFTPTASYWIELWSTLRYECSVDSVEITGAGDLVLPTPWVSSQFQSLRFERTLDVMYVASGTGVKKRIERRNSSSWSITNSDEQDGPFRAVNTDESITIQPSVTTGNGTMTASRALFKTTHVGALWKLTQNGQRQSRTVSGADQWSDPVKVVGIGTGRSLSWTVTGTFVGTVRLQRSVGNTTSWTDVTSGTGSFTTTVAGTFTYTDSGLDNQTVYYRVGIKTGEYTSGSAVVDISFSGGATDGIVRITQFTSATAVSIEVLTGLASTAPTFEWSEGAWSDLRGHPRALTLNDGRLWNARDDQFWGSYSDLYESQKIGDQAANAVARSVAVGTADEILWLMSLSRLLIGTAGAEIVVRSNAFDEALTSTNLTVREMSTYGSANVQPLKVDNRGIYVERSTWRPMELKYNPEVQDYTAAPLTRLHKNIGRPGITDMAIARQPDTRIFFIRADGQCLVKLYHPAEDVAAWVRLVTDGAFENVAVLPGQNGEDLVYFIVRRTVNGVTVRYLELLDVFFWTDAAATNILDSYVRQEGAAATTITGLGHLVGKTVQAYGDGADMGLHVVPPSGTITIARAKAKRAAGLPYTGRYRSSKLAIGAQMGTAVAQKAKPLQIALVLNNSSPVIRYGQTFEKMDTLSERDIISTYDAGPGLREGTTERLSVPGDPTKGDHNNDPRLCLEFSSPFPVRLGGYVLSHQINEKVG